MDSATREQSLTVQQAVPSVRALQTEPEVLDEHGQQQCGTSVGNNCTNCQTAWRCAQTLTPIRHGFIWKRSRLFKQWLSRWAQLDARGFVYATNPKVRLRSCGTAFPHPCTAFIVMTDDATSASALWGLGDSFGLRAAGNSWGCLAPDTRVHVRPDYRTKVARPQPHAWYVRSQNFAEKLKPPR